MKIAKPRFTRSIPLLGGVLLLAACPGSANPEPAAPSSRARETATGWRKLTPAEARVIVHGGTELPGSGRFLHHHAKGQYRCKRCNLRLFNSSAKFDSQSGWPSFDQALPGAVQRIPDPDGQRVEIRCSRCGAHLGHVFTGEAFTPKNTRYCVNSVSLAFEADRPTREVAYFAGGCFWGVEHVFEKAPGVVEAVSGYMGGRAAQPTYPQVSNGRTGHAETVKVVFDPVKTSFEKLARLFFEIHDPTQVGGQGVDMGSQYRSAVFYTSASQERVTRTLIERLRGRGYKVVTQVTKAGTFWPAEAFHQDYYRRTGGTSVCHTRVHRFGDDGASSSE